jgi:predicted PurR-regulated permease PerM
LKITALTKKYRGAVMNKNHILIIFIGLIFIGLIITNLYTFKKTVELNEQLSRIYDLEAEIARLKIEHRNEIDRLNKEHQDELNRLTNNFTEKYEVVEKALNAFMYELDEFYVNKHILEKDYLEQKAKIAEIRKKLEENN